MKNVFILAFAIIFCNYLSFAQTATIGTVSANTGSVVNVPITFTGFNGANSPVGISLFVSYDNTQLTPTTTGFANYSSLLTGWVVNPNYNSNTMAAVWTSLDQVSIPNGTVLFDLQFTFTGTTETNITWNTGVCEILNYDLEAITTTFVDGNVSLPPPISAPTLVNPSNISINVTTSPTFQWNSVSEATSYSLQVSTSSSFGTTVINPSGLTGTSYNGSGLSNSTTYYWRMNATNGTQTSAWSSVWSFTTNTGGIPVPSSWDFVSNTGNSSNVGILPSATFMIGTERAVQNGDAIGAFYTRNNQLFCAGYLVWDGITFGWTVWGDNDQTTLKDGFTVGEAYSFRVWDGQLGNEWPAEVVYQMGPEAYQVNGLTVLSGVTAITNITQQISFNNGWNMISSYVTPSDLNIQTLLLGIINQLVIIKNSSGQAYWPPFMNSLTTWNTTQGYAMNNNASGTLEITGQQIKPEETPLTLNASNWYWIPYYRTTAMATATALASITGNFVIIKSISGQTYWPPFQYSLTQLEPGKGYMIYMSSSDELTYPENSAGKFISNEINQVEVKYLIPEISGTGNSANLGLYFDSKYDGNEVGVWNSNGDLIGSALITNGLAGLTIWGYDELQGKEISNEELIVKLYDINSNNFKNIDIQDFQDLSSKTDKLIYRKDGIFVAKAVVNEDLPNIIILKNSPNPFSSSTLIEYTIPFDGHYKIELFDTKSIKISTLIESEAKAGNHQISLNSNDISSGIYSLVLTIGTETLVKQIVIVK